MRTAYIPRTVGTLYPSKTMVEYGWPLLCLERFLEEYCVEMSLEVMVSLRRYRPCLRAHEGTEGAAAPGVDMRTAMGYLQRLV